MNYPRPVTSVHQIEITSHCNLRCVYCPSRVLDQPLTDDAGVPLPIADGGGFGREKLDITLEHFDRALEHAVYHEGQDTQGELALTGIGEAFLHPQFVDLLARAREALPANLITMSTNGLLIADDGPRRDGLLCGMELVEALKPHRPAMYVSTHRPEKAKIAHDRLRDAGLLYGKNTAFVDDAFDWADKGQGGIEWDVSIPEGSITCDYLKLGWCVVLADGRITTCCLDAEGAGVIGHVEDRPGSLKVQPWEGVKQGCSGCHMRVP